jgi:hypothetical protein
MNGLAASAEIEHYTRNCKAQLVGLAEEAKAKMHSRWRLSSMLDNIQVAAEKVNAHLGGLIVTTSRPICLVRPSLSSLRGTVAMLESKANTNLLNVRVGLGSVFLDGAPRPSPIDDTHLDGVDFSLAVPGKSPIVGITNLPVMVVDLLLARSIWGNDYTWAALDQDEERLIQLITTPQLQKELN